MYKGWCCPTAWFIAGARNDTGGWGGPAEAVVGHRQPYAAATEGVWRVFARRCQSDNDTSTSLRWAPLPCALCQLLGQLRRLYAASSRHSYVALIWLEYGLCSAFSLDREIMFSVLIGSWHGILRTRVRTIHEHCCVQCVYTGLCRRQRGCYYEGISLGAENVHIQVCR